MRKLISCVFAAAAIFIIPNAQAYDWLEYSTIAVPAGGPSSHMNQPLFVNTYTGDGMSKYPPGQWSDVDVSSFVPTDAKAIRLDGLLIITHGTAATTCDLTLAFRAKGETIDYAYTMQAVSVTTGGGVRSVGGTFVPLDENKKFQVKWTRSTTAQWPNDCSYGFNLRITAYLK